MGAMSKGLRALKPRGEEIIKDWKWRPSAEVRAEVPASKLSPHIADVYGRFMAQQGEKAAKGAITPRDAVKAYGITRSSVNREARELTDPVLGQGLMRPEGAFSEWLLSPQGQRYLDAAQEGKVDESAIGDIVERFKPFGMSNTLGDDLRWAADSRGAWDEILPAVLGPVDAWRARTSALRGIGPAKSGFFASLLGRGDLPTLDARQLKLHTGAPAADASKFMRRQGGEGGYAGVDRLARRQADWGLELPPSLEPYRQHLTHHQVWDDVGGTQTTHADLVGAMERGRASLPAVAALGTAAAGGAGGLSAYEAMKERERQRQLRMRQIEQEQEQLPQQ